MIKVERRFILKQKVINNHKDKVFNRLDSLNLLNNNKIIQKMKKFNKNKKKKHKKSNYLEIPAEKVLFKYK